MSDRNVSIAHPKDNACNPPLCIRRITRQQSSGDYRFEVQWRTSAGIITTKGWRWLRGLNQIKAPTCQGHHIFALPLAVRASVRRLFTRLMLEQNGFTVPPIERRKKHETQHPVTELRASSPDSSIGPVAALASLEG